MSTMNAPSDQPRHFGNVMADSAIARKGIDLPKGWGGVEPIFDAELDDGSHYLNGHRHCMRLFAGAE